MYVHPDYSPTGKDAVYDVMLREMTSGLDVRKNIVLDGTFYTKEIRNRCVKACAGKAALFFIEVTAEEAVIRERLGKQREFSDADFQVYTQVKALWQAMHASHLVLESDNTNINEMLSRARAYCQ